MDLAWETVNRVFMDETVVMKSITETFPMKDEDAPLSQHEVLQMFTFLKLLIEHPKSSRSHYGMYSDRHPGKNSRKAHCLLQHSIYFIRVHVVIRSPA